MAEIVREPGSALDVDNDLLIEAQRQIGASSRNSAINEALHRLVERERDKRRHARDQIRRLIEDGELDFRSLESVHR